MTFEAFRNEVHARLGLDDEAALERGIFATVHAVAPSIQPEDRRALPDAVPEPIRREITIARYVGPLDEEAFYESVAHRAAVPLGLARELSQVVLHELGTRIGAELRSRLAHHAGPSMAWLWDQPSAPEAAPRPAGTRSRPGGGHTLASGRPGSRKPLSESGPLGHTDSIARSDNPREDRKLSSARGTTQEREGRTLAEGRPGSAHPVSDDRGD